MNLVTQLRAIERYHQYKIPPGSYIRSVLENNLAQAMGSSDHESYKHLRNVCHFMIWHLPANCWGSPEEVRDWLAGDDQPVEKRGGLR